MSKTLFFYDLETSGLNPREDRIMQFAGIRTDLDFNQIGDPINIIVKLNDDTLPSPDAVMVTGITPQQTLDEGYSEAEFTKILINDIFTPDTTVIGFNNIRFDDEFVRYLLWRNFYDAYEWSWKDGRSRWDILDLVRMTRALRPEGINWPFNKDGVAINTLESISQANNLTHEKAHDALSDVKALIAVTKLIREKQSQLYDYLFKMRDKKSLKEMINLDDKKPFVYVSGRLESDYNKATVAFPLTAGKNGNVIVYDLRYDPTSFINMNQKKLAKKLYATWEERQAEDFVKLPVKELQYNHAPAVAPINVLEKGDGWKKVQLDAETIKKHQKILLSAPAFAENIRSIYENREEYPKSLDVEAQLYDSFVLDEDKIRLEAVRNANATQLADMNPEFIDDRLPELLLHYKARNYPKSLSADEIIVWEKWRSTRILSKIDSYMDKISQLSASETDEAKLFILQELQLWAESIIPSID